MVEIGQPDEYRTTFYKGTDLDTLVNEWVEKLQQIEARWPSLYAYEIDQGKKVGPMSVMKPLDQRLADIDNYYESSSPSVLSASDRAIRSALHEWKGVYPLRMRGAERTVQDMKMSTNSGTPYFTKRRRVVDKTLPLSDIIFENGDYVPVDPGKYKYAAILGWRGQEGGRSKEDVKQRVIWMFPLEVNIWELRTYQPIISAFQRLNLVPAWVGQEAVDAAVTKLFYTKAIDDAIICTDFDKFDQSFNPVLQNLSSQLIGSLFKQDDEIHNWLREIYPIKFNIPLLLGMDKIRKGAHGMASGSGGTNVDETLAHRTLQYEAALSCNKELNPNSQCLGDDGIISYPGCTVEDVMSTYTSFGLKMNESKQYVNTQDCRYLRRWYHRDYTVKGTTVGVYPTARALGRLAEQERYYDPEVWSKEMVALRQLSIIENCKWHPLREEFADFCMKGDKYGLGIGIPGFLDNIEGFAKEAIDYMPDFLGYTRSLSRESSHYGISSWWIVNYLKSKA
jgi:hypothetical protein